LCKEPLPVALQMVLSGFARSSPDPRFFFFGRFLFKDGHYEKRIENHQEEKSGHDNGYPVVFKNLPSHVVAADIGEDADHQARKDHDDDDGYRMSQRDFKSPFFLRIFFPELDYADSRHNVDKAFERRRHEDDKEVFPRKQCGEADGNRKDAKKDYGYPWRCV